MLIFLYGSDNYRSLQKLNEIVGHYKKIHKSGLNLRFFDEENLDFAEFKDEIQQSSMFKEKKLLILKNIFLNPDFKAKFLEQGKNFIKSEDIILIYEKNEVPANDKLVQFLKKEGKSQEFKTLEGEKLKIWLKKEFEKYQAKIEPGVIEKLIEFVGNNLWQLSNEIKKLINYKYCPVLTKTSQKIEVKDIELLVKPKIETDIFKTIDALAQKDKKKALKLLHQHLEKNDNPLYLLSMINFQFRNLLLVKELIEKNQPYYSILRKTQFNPFVLKKSYQQAQRFTFEELKKIYQKIFQTDFNIKTGKVEPETALDLLIAEI